MLNIPLIHYYASLIQKKVMTLNEIHDEIKIYVEKFLNGEKLIDDSKEEQSEEEDKEKELLGAIYIDPIIKEIPREFNKIEDDIYIKIPIDIEEILLNIIDKDEPIPENISYSLVLYEKQYTSENSQLYVRIEDNSILSITGYDDHEFNSGDKFLRCDVLLESSNYSPIRLVFYINIE